MHVPDCSCDTGNGVLPMNEIRISFFGRVSVPGTYMFRFVMAGQGATTPDGAEAARR